MNTVSRPRRSKMPSQDVLSTKSPHGGGPDLRVTALRRSSRSRWARTQTRTHRSRAPRRSSPSLEGSACIRLTGWSGPAHWKKLPLPKAVNRGAVGGANGLRGRRPLRPSTGGGGRCPKSGRCGTMRAVTSRHALPSTNLPAEFEPASWTRSRGTFAAAEPSTRCRPCDTPRALLRPNVTDISDEDQPRP